MNHTSAMARIAAAVMTILYAGCSLYGPAETPKRPGLDHNFDYCWALLRDFSIFQEKLPANPYVFDDVGSMFESIGDRWTEYFGRDIALTFMSALTTSNVGLGVLLDSVEQGFRIRQVFANSPAQRAGLLAGDTATAVNGTLLRGLTWQERVQRLKGAEGEVKELSIVRDTAHVDIGVTLGSFMAPSLFTDSLDSAVAYLALEMFTDESSNPGGSAAEFREALQKSSWAEYTIFDLRGNGGGIVGQSLDIAGEFVAQGTAVVHSSERFYDSVADTIGTRNEIWPTTRPNGLARSRKFYVLIDHSTASPSEMVVSCLRDYRPDIKTAGATTFGKARSQYVWFPTPDSGLAKVTFSLLTPVKGAAYDLVGMGPDIPLPDSATALAAVRDLIRTAQGRPLAKSAGETEALRRIGRLREQIGPRRWEALAVAKRTSPRR